MQVRAAIPADVASLEDIVRAGAIRGMSFFAVDDATRTAESDRSARRLQEALYAAEQAPERSAVLVAVDEHDAPVGVGAVHRNGRRSYLHLLNTAQDGNGAARAVTTARLALARSWGCHWALTEVFIANTRAMRCAEAAGFQRACERPGAGLVNATLVLMVRAL